MLRGATPACRRRLSEGSPYTIGRARDDELRATTNGNHPVPSRNRFRCVRGDMARLPSGVGAPDPARPIGSAKPWMSAVWFDTHMTITRTVVQRETARRKRRIGLQNGEDIHRLRTEAGLSLGELGEVVGVHKSHLGRIEASQVQASLEVLTAIGVALGADLSVRYFPGAGPRLHDRFQAAMTEVLLRALDGRWHADLEVPITRPARGVIDVVLTDGSDATMVAGEVCSELRRLEQQIRWSAEKADGLIARLEEGDPTRQHGTVSRLLVLRSTVATREIARRYEATLAAAYPARTRDVVLALTTPSTPWPGAGIVWMHHHGTDTRLMELPPPHVSLGR